MDKASTPMEEKEITLAEAGKIMHVAPSTMLRYVREGRFPSAKDGMIKPSAVHSYLVDGLQWGVKKRS